MSFQPANFTPVLATPIRGRVSHPTHEVANCLPDYTGDLNSDDVKWEPVFILGFGSRKDTYEVKFLDGSIHRLIKSRFIRPITSSAAEVTDFVSSISHNGGDTGIMEETVSTRSQKRKRGEDSDGANNNEDFGRDDQNIIMQGQSSPCPSSSTMSHALAPDFNHGSSPLEHLNISLQVDSDGDGWVTSNSSYDHFLESSFWVFVRGHGQMTDV